MAQQPHQRAAELLQRAANLLTGVSSPTSATATPAVIPPSNTSTSSNAVHQEFRSTSSNAVLQELRSCFSPYRQYSAGRRGGRGRQHMTFRSTPSTPCTWTHKFVCLSDPFQVIKKENE